MFETLSCWNSGGFDFPEAVVKLEYVVNGVSIKSTNQDSRAGFQVSIYQTSQGVLETLGTRHAGAESNKCDGIDSVFEIDEAAEMRGNVSNDGSTGPDEYQRNDESNIAIGHCWKKMEYCQILLPHFYLKRSLLKSKNELQQMPEIETGANE